MLNKRFAKYARAVSNENERKSLYRLFCAKTISSFIFYTICIAIIVEAILFSEEMKKEGNDLPFIIFGITLFLWIVSAVISLTLWLVFRSTYQGIIKRAPSQDEMPEVARYRQKTREEGNHFLKTMRWPIFLLIVGIVSMIVTLSIDLIRHPDSEDLTTIGYVGIGIFGVCFAIFIFSLFFRQTKRTASGQSIEMQTADEVKKIDQAQGREHPYSLQEDKNAQTYRYLFPNQQLYNQAENWRKKQIKATSLSTIISFFLGFVVAFVFFSPYIFDWKIVGFAFPVFLTITFLTIFCTILPYTKQMNKLEKQQKKELETYSFYKKHLSLYRLYENFSKGKGNILLISFGVIVLLSYGLAIAFPNALWSVLPIVVLFPFLLLNNHFFVDLRKKALPIEEEINQPYEAKFCISIEEISQTIEIIYDENRLSSQNGEGNFSLYLGQLDLCLKMETERKQILDFSGTISLADVETASISLPEEITIGLLSLDSEETFPSFGTCRIQFDTRCVFDPDRHILQIGVRNEEATLYKIFKNVYAQRSPENELICLLITNLSANH